MTDQPVHERVDGEACWRANTEPKELLAAAYDAYAGNLYRYALMLLADHGAAEDAIHDAFTKLARMGRKMGTINSYEGYLRTVVRNECYRIIQHRQRWSKAVDITSVDSILEPACSESCDEDDRVVVEKAVCSLPADQREVIYLKVYEQMTFQQIAEMLDISICYQEVINKKMIGERR